MSGSDTSNAAQRPGLGRRLLGVVGALGFLASAAALSAVGLTAIYAASESAAPAPKRPLPVATATLERADAYETTETYTGRVEPARETALGFEVGGELVAVFVEEGDRIAEGAPVAQLDAAQLIAERDRLTAEKARLEASLALAQRTRARQDSLSGDGFSSVQRADEARTAETTTEAQIAAVEAQLRQMEIRIDKALIAAPFTGVVAERRADPGAIVAPGQIVVRILEAGRPLARIGLPPERAAALDFDRVYTLTLRGVEATARLSAIRPDIDPATRTVAALFELDLEAATGGSGAGVVAPFGEVIRLSLPLRVEAEGAWAPLAALQEDAKGLWRILIIEENAEGAPVVAARVVEALHVSGERAYVDGPRIDGASYIIGGVNRVSVGDVVAPTPAR